MLHHLGNINNAHTLTNSIIRLTTH